MTGTTGKRRVVRGKPTSDELIGGLEERAHCDALAQFPPEVIRRIRKLVQQASAEYDQALEDAGLGPRGIVIRRPKAGEAG